MHRDRFGYSRSDLVCLPGDAQHPAPVARLRCRPRHRVTPEAKKRVGLEPRPVLPDWNDSMRVPDNLSEATAAWGVQSKPRACNSTDHRQNK